MGFEAFGIEKKLARDLLTQVDKGETQLPKSQLGWVWPDRNVTSLIASISLGYPAGTVMMLAQDGPTRVKTRPVEKHNIRGNATRGWFYLDMEQALRDEVDPGRRRALHSGRQGWRRFPGAGAAGVAAW